MNRKHRRIVASNPIPLAIRKACKLSEHDRARILQPAQLACARMSEGVASEADWMALASSCNVAVAIELQGVVRGLREHLHTTELALQTIHRRAQEDDSRYPYALHIDEIEQLRTFLTVHAFQLGQLSRGEYDQAVDYAIDEVRSTGGIVIPASATPAHQGALQL